MKDHVWLKIFQRAFSLSRLAVYYQAEALCLHCIFGNYHFIQWCKATDHYFLLIFSLSLNFINYAHNTDLHIFIN